MLTAYPSRALSAFDTGEAPAVVRAVQLADGHQVYVSTSLEGASIEALFAVHPDPPAEQSSSADTALATRHVHVEDVTAIDAAAQPGDMLVLSPDDPLPLRAQVVSVDRRTLDGGGAFEAHAPPRDTIDLVIIAREQAG